MNPLEEMINHGKLLKKFDCRDFNNLGSSGAYPILIRTYHGYFFHQKADMIDFHDPKYFPSHLLPIFETRIQQELT